MAKLDKYLSIHGQPSKYGMVSSKYGMVFKLSSIHPINNLINKIYLGRANCARATLPLPATVRASTRQSHVRLLRQIYSPMPVSLSFFSISTNGFPQHAAQAACSPPLQSTLFPQHVRSICALGPPQINFFFLPN